MSKQHTDTNQLTELVLHSPDCFSHHFYVEKRGKGFQRWTRGLITGEEIEILTEDSQTWQRGTVDCWYTEDGSGNASDMHYFLRWEDAEGSWRYDLHDNLRVRLPNVPTDDELRAAPKWCEAYIWGEFPWEDRHCNEHGQLYTYAHGGEAWYCPVHAPSRQDLSGQGKS